MRLVIIESPYASDPKRNLLYLDYCIRDCFARGEASFASHKMYTTALDDGKPEQRALGIAGGLAWRMVRDVTPVFYVDLGWSGGMRDAMGLYEDERRYYEVRNLPVETWREFEQQAEGLTVRYDTGREFIDKARALFPDGLDIDFGDDDETDDERSHHAQPST